MNIKNFFSIPDLSMRYNGPELMDDMEQTAAMIYNTLDELKLINRFISRSDDIIDKYVFANIKKNNHKNVVAFDLGSGGGDIASWFTRKARSLGIEVKFYCIDHDQRCIDYARKNCMKYPSINFLRMSVEELDKIQIIPDYIIANHFLHHIDSCKIPVLLRTIAEKARCGFVVNDLHRSVLSYIGFLFLRPLFKKNSFTWRDGLISIRKGFTKSEINKYIKECDLIETAECKYAFPGRILITNLVP